MMAMEGAPVLCRRCGAPTDVQLDLTVRCRFCGTMDRLPANAAARALDIRERLSQAAAHATQLAAGEAAMAALFENPSMLRRNLASMATVLGIVLLSTVGGIVYTAATMSSAPLGMSLEVFVSSLQGLVWIVGVGLGIVLSFLVGRSTYQRHVRTQIAPRPALYPGAPLRCRACGGNLPMQRATQVACSFCGTQNLMTAVAAADARRQLDAEVAGYRARASGVAIASTRAGSHMSAAMVVCFVGSNLGVQALFYVLRQLVKAIS